MGGLEREGEERREDCFFSMGFSVGWALLCFGEWWCQVGAFFEVS